MKKRIFFRIFPFNRLTFPLLLNIWESVGLDREFAIKIVESDGPSLHTCLPAELADLTAADVLVYSFMTPHLPQIAAEIKKIRSARPAGKRPLLAAGGPHVTGEQKLASIIGFDVLFVGPGEETFQRFGQDLLDGKFEKKEDQPLIYDGIGIGRTGCRQLTPNSWETYIPASRYFKSLPPLEIMRGCYWRCRYCQTGSGRPAFRGANSIQAYLEEMQRRHFKRITFIAPSALEFAAQKAGHPDLARIEQLLSQVQAGGFRFIEYGIFPSEIRPDQASRDALLLLKRYVTNRCLTIGAQSGLDDQLRLLDRGHAAAAIEPAVAAAADAGFQVNLDFIFALPGETEAQRRGNIAFILALQKKYRLHAHLHHFFPLAGSVFADRLPSFLSAAERRRLGELRRWGVASDWWREGEARARNYFAWLKRDYPAFFSRYH